MDFRWDVPTSGSYASRLGIFTRGSGAAGLAERWRFAGAELIGISSLSVVGYGVGSGGTVTQATSKSTAVTINRPCGKITMHNASLNGGADVAFTVNNSVVKADDVVIATVAGGVATAGTYLCGVEGVAAGSFVIHVKNVSTGPASEAVVIAFAIIRGATS
jgi:hypothetical protein